MHPRDRYDRKRSRGAPDANGQAGGTGARARALGRRRLVAGSR